MATHPRPYYLTVDKYEQMIAAGIFTENDRVELIAGEIVEMAALGIRHATCVNRLTRFLVLTVPENLTVSVQNPIRLSNDGEPEPDLAVIYDREYQTTPAATDVLFVVEVSDATITYDRGMKLPLYAAAGIAEAWLVDLNAGIVERHTEPYAGAYRQVIFARAGETLPSTTVPAIAIPVADILR